MARPENLKCVLFDFDGTLADTEETYIRLDAEALRTYGIEPTEEDMTLFPGAICGVAGKAVLNRYGLDTTPEEFRARRGEPDKIYREWPLEAHDGALELLDRVKEMGFLCGVVSTTGCANVVCAMNRLGITSFVDIIIANEMVEKHKPEPDPYLAALNVLGLDVSEAMAVEDSTVGIQAAKNAGLYTVAFASSPLGQDSSIADEVVGSLREIVF